MFNRFAIAAAGGIVMFGIAGAGASLLGTSTAKPAVHPISTTCRPGNWRFANVTSGADVVSTRLSHQSFEPQCDGDFVQVALSMSNRSVVYSNTVWVPAADVTAPDQESFLLGGNSDLASFGYALSGEDLYPHFPAGVLACAVTSTALTVTARITTAGEGLLMDEAGSVTGSLPASCAAK